MMGSNFSFTKLVVQRPESKSKLIINFEGLMVQNLIIILGRLTRAYLSLDLLKLGKPNEGSKSGTITPDMLKGCNWAFN